MEYQSQDLLSDYSRRSSRVGLAMFVLMLASSVAAIVLQIVFVALMPEIRTEIPPWFNWTVTILSLYVCAAPFSYLLMRTVPPVQLKRRRLTARSFFLFLMIAFTFLIVGSLIGQGVNSVISNLFREQGSDITEALASSTLWISCVYSLAIAPLMEEFFFRKLLIDRLAPLGQGVALLVSGIYFGLFHGNLDQFFYAALLGCLLAYVYYHTGNLWYCVGIHSIVNFFGGILPTLLQTAYPVFTSGTEEEIVAATQAHPLAYLSLLAVTYLPYLFALAGLIAFCMYARRLLSTVTPCPIPREMRFRTVVLNPGVLLYVAVCFITIVISIIL